MQLRIPGAVVHSRLYARQIGQMLGQSGSSHYSGSMHPYEACKWLLCNGCRVIWQINHNLNSGIVCLDGIFVPSVRLKRKNLS